MYGPIQALLELVEELIADSPHDTSNVLNEPNIRLLLDPSTPTASRTSLHDDFLSAHDVKYISHLLHTAPDQHILALHLGHDSAHKTLREVLTPVELSRVDQATYARLQILKRQSVDISDALSKHLDALETPREYYRLMKKTMKKFVRTAGIAAVLDETAEESLISLLWDDLVGVEDALNLLELAEGKERAEVLVVKLEAILAKSLFVGFEGAGLRGCQFRWVVEMRGMCREVMGL